MDQEAAVFKSRVQGWRNLQKRESKNLVSTRPVKKKISRETWVSDHRTGTENQNRREEGLLKKKSKQRHRREELSESTLTGEAFFSGWTLQVKEEHRRVYSKKLEKQINLLGAMERRDGG